MLCFKWWGATDCLRMRQDTVAAQSRSLAHVMSCHVMSCHVMSITRWWTWHGPFLSDADRVLHPLHSANDELSREVVSNKRQVTCSCYGHEVQVHVPAVAFHYSMGQWTFRLLKQRPCSETPRAVTRGDWNASVSDVGLRWLIFGRFPITL